MMRLKQLIVLNNFGIKVHDDDDDDDDDGDDDDDDDDAHSNTGNAVADTDTKAVSARRSAMNNFNHDNNNDVELEHSSSHSHSSLQDQVLQRLQQQRDTNWFSCGAADAVIYLKTVVRGTIHQNGRYMMQWLILLFDRWRHRVLSFTKQCVLQQQLNQFADKLKTMMIDTKSMMMTA
jgi:hypothetical protein